MKASDIELEQLEKVVNKMREIGCIQYDGIVITPQAPMEYARRLKAATAPEPEPEPDAPPAKPKMSIADFRKIKAQQA